MPSALSTLPERARLQPWQIAGTLADLAHKGLVRRLQATPPVWEIAHDFLAHPGTHFEGGPSSGDPLARPLRPWRDGGGRHPARLHRDGRSPRPARARAVGNGDHRRGPRRQSGDLWRSIGAVAAAACLTSLRVPAVADVCASRLCGTARLFASWRKAQPVTLRNGARAEPAADAVVAIGHG